MSSKTITFRFPDEVIEVIEAQAQASGRNRTAVVMDALAQFYGFSLLTSVPNPVEALQQQVHSLSRQVADLAEQLAQTRQNPSRGDGSKLSVLPEIVNDLHYVRESEIASGSEAAVSVEVIEGLIAEEQQQFVTQLEHQARTLDQILSTNPDIVFVLDRRGRFTYINPAGGRAFGFERNYFLGKTFQELGFSVFAKALITQCEAVFTTGRAVCDEINIPTVHESRAYEYILSPIYAADGGIDTVVCTARDITERKQTEMVIRESEEKYRNLFEAANDSIFITDLTTQRLLNVNRNAARRLGHTRQELLQLTIDDINTPIADDLRETINQRLQADGGVIFEHWHRHKNGKEIPVEISCRVIEYEGKLAIQSFVRDISERKRTEERLRLLEAAVLNANDAIVITEAEPIDGFGPQIVYVNQSFVQMTGYDAKELIGQTPRLLQGAKTDQTQLDQLRSAMAQRQSTRIQLINYRKDGSEFWVEMTIAPILDEQGQHTHWIAIQHDITEHKQTKEV